MQLREMTLEVDTHTHTILSGHAWSTLRENCCAARGRGMKGLCLTEHAPGIEGGAPSFIPHSQRMLPQEVEGIRVYQGIEVNILDHQNHLDIPEEYLKLCEFVIASIHSHMFPEKMDRAANTATYLEILKNPYVDIIGHPGDPRYAVDYRELFRVAKETGTLLEINNASLTPGGFREGSRENIKKILLMSMEEGQPVVLGSDAHFYRNVGDFSYAEEMGYQISRSKEYKTNKHVFLYKRK